jgi:hypothetical protein
VARAAARAMQASHPLTMLVNAIAWHRLHAGPSGALIGHRSKRSFQQIVAGARGARRSWLHFGLLMVSMCEALGERPNSKQIGLTTVPEHLGASRITQVHRGCEGVLAGRQRQRCTDDCTNGQPAWQPLSIAQD